MSNKITLTKGNEVKRTKSAELAAVLEKQGWERETSGGDKLDKLAKQAIDDAAKEAKAKEAAEKAAAAKAAKEAKANGKGK